MSFSQRFCKNTKELLTNPTPQQEERLEYAQLFFSGLQMVTRVASINEYARDLDYDQINEEELLWLAREIRELPEAENGLRDYYYDHNNNDKVFLRDQVVRSLFEMASTREKVVSLPAKRMMEEYF